MKGLYRPEDLESLRLGVYEASLVRRAYADLTNRKAALADACIQIDAAKDQVHKAEKAFLAAVEQAAFSVGIDPTNPAEGRWSFDPENMSFTRVE